MPWLSCNLTDRPHLEAAILNRFETKYDANGGAPEMLLVAHNLAPGVVTLWLRLADDRYRAVFPEFEYADEDDLPARVVPRLTSRRQFQKKGG